MSKHPQIIHIGLMPRLAIATVVATIIYVVARVYGGEMSVYAKWVIAIAIYGVALLLAWKPRWIPDFIASFFYGN